MYHNILTPIWQTLRSTLIRTSGFESRINFWPLSCIALGVDPGKGKEGKKVKGRGTGEVGGIGPDRQGLCISKKNLSIDPILYCNSMCPSIRHLSAYCIEKA